MELARCRMCGGEAELYWVEEGVRIARCECGAGSGFRNTSQEAADAWNKLMGVTLDELKCLAAEPLFGKRLGEYKLDKLIKCKDIIRAAAMERRAKKYE